VRVLVKTTLALMGISSLMQLHFLFSCLELVLASDAGGSGEFGQEQVRITRLAP
jgi:hypothetical protein